MGRAGSVPCGASGGLGSWGFLAGWSRTRDLAWQVPFPSCSLDTAGDIKSIRACEQGSWGRPAHPSVILSDLRCLLALGQLQLGPGGSVVVNVDGMKGWGAELMLPVPEQRTSSAGGAGVVGLFPCLD